jgi:hypothetical protein
MQHHTADLAVLADSWTLFVQSAPWISVGYDFGLIICSGCSFTTM